MDECTKENLLEQFRTYLEFYEEEDDEEDEQQTDLFSLFTELAVLRNEIKLESRQVKTALDTLKEGFDLVQSSHNLLAKDLEHCHSEQQTQRRDIMQSMLLDFLEVYDRLEAGMTTLNKYTPSVRKFFCDCKAETRLIKGLQEGQAMTMRRLDQLLARYNVQPLEVLDKPLDPHCMRAVEVDSQPQLENGIVTDELRKGFLWEDQVLRPAEVKVNKKKIIK